MINISAIKEADPLAVKLIEDASSIKDDKTAKSFCANKVFYSKFKPRIREIAGWDRVHGPDFMRSEEAYSVLYDAVYDPLPPCRNCACIAFG